MKPLALDGGDDQAWLRAQAFALTFFKGDGAPLHVEQLIERVLSTWAGAHRPQLAGDLAYAIAQQLVDLEVPGQHGLQLQDMDTGEPLDPEVFTATEEGRVTVWAARLVVAALDRDEPMVEAHVLALVGEAMAGQDPARWIDRLATAAAQLHREHAERIKVDDIGQMVQTGHIPRYRWACTEGLVETVDTRETRDRAAAEHILDTGHIVTIHTVTDGS